MNRALRRRLALLVAIAAVLAGGTVAALAAGTPHAHSRQPAAHGSAHRHGGAMLQAAAAYLGTAPTQLRQELQAGKTLAQLAASSGKSEAGLISALVAAKRARLAAASAHLEERVAAAVKRVHGHVAGGHPGARAAVRDYLGLTPRQLHSRLLAGQTLAQIANATPGKSQAGLVTAIVAARQSRIGAASAAGKLTKAQAEARAAALTKRVTQMVERPLRAHADG